MASNEMFSLASLYVGMAEKSAEEEMTEAYTGIFCPHLMADHRVEFSR